MKKDIKIPPVKGVSVAAVQEFGDDNLPVFNVYLINQRKEKLEKVLVTSKGYATVKKTGQKIITSTLRKSLGDLESMKAQKIEPIMENLFGLNNEYWVSFWIGNKMYDKKYIFLSETIKKENFTTVPVLDKQGVLIC
jgi:hypothetical protein